MNKPIDYNHVYLYAKEHYKHNDLLKDLSIILAERSWMPRDHYYGAAHIANTLTDLVFEEINRSGNPKHFFAEFINNIAPENVWKVGGQECNDHHVKVILACLSILSLSQVKDDEGNTLIELGEPDSSILPLAKE